MIAECMPSATWWVGVISMPVNPAQTRSARYSLIDRAPAMQPTWSPRSARAAGDRLMTQLEMTTLTVSGGSGMASTFVRLSGLIHKGGEQGVCKNVADQIDVIIKLLQEAILAPLTLPDAVDAHGLRRQ